MALNLGSATASASMADAEEQQTEGTVAAQRAAMVPRQDALGAADMATPKANLIEANQQPGSEVQKLLDIEDGAAVEHHNLVMWRLRSKRGTTWGMARVAA